jgi:hypothetical protein
LLGGGLLDGPELLVAQHGSDGRTDDPATPTPTRRQVLRWLLRDCPALSEVPRDVLTWIVLGLPAWLAIGVLAAQLFGAFVSGNRRWWERD